MISTNAKKIFFKLYIYIYIYIFIYILIIYTHTHTIKWLEYLPMAWDTGVQSQDESD